MYPTLQRALRHFKRARAFRSPLYQVIDVLRHWLLLNVSATDYYHFHFYDPAIAWSDKPRYVCPRGSRYYPYQANPLQFTAALSDKYLMKHLLRGFGLPTPAVIARLGQRSGVNHCAEFERVVRTLPEQFVIKANQGSGGRKLHFIAHRQGELWCNGEHVSVQALWDILTPGLDSGYYIERCLSNTRWIQTISPGCLNTYRVVTIRTPDGRYHAPFVQLRLGHGDSRVDNTESGGIPVRIGSDGVSIRINSFTPVTHPDTDAGLLGLEVPNYTEIVALALRASRCFHFLGTIGWDIADTPDGLTIIEGNTLWGPHPTPILTDELMHSLPRFDRFSRWNKQAMWPGMVR